MAAALEILRVQGSPGVDGAAAVLGLVGRVGPLVGQFAQSTANSEIPTQGKLSFLGAHAAKPTLHPDVRVVVDSCDRMLRKWTATAATARPLFMERGKDWSKASTPTQTFG